MNAALRLGLVLLVGLAIPDLSAAEAPKPAVEIIDFGLYAATPTRRVPDPNVPGGEQGRATGIRLLEQTETVPGKIGQFFGFRFRVNDPALNGKDLRLAIRHPPMTDPSGRTATEGARRLVVRTGEREEVHLFGFDHRWEIAAGDWTFQVVYEGKVLVEKRLRVVAASD